MLLEALGDVEVGESTQESLDTSVRFVLYASEAGEKAENSV
jgi:hypothetical protein